MSAEPILHRSYFHPTPQKLPSSTATTQSSQHQQPTSSSSKPPLPPNTSSTSSTTSTNFLHPHRYTSHHASLRHLGGFGSRLAGTSASTSRIMGPTYHSSTTHNTPQKQFMYNRNHSDIAGSYMGPPPSSPPPPPILINQTHFDNHQQVII